MDKITKEQAIRLIGNDKQVHTFRQTGFALMGCDWDRESLLEAFDKYEETLQLAGEQASAMRHGLVFEDEKGYCFVETLEDVLAEVNKECA